MKTSAKPRSRSRTIAVVCRSRRPAPAKANLRGSVAINFTGLTVERPASGPLVFKSEIASPHNDRAAVDWRSAKVSRPLFAATVQ